MSSNIQIQRICQQCGKEFTARTTVTQFCSSKCIKAKKREQIRNEKIEISNKQTLTVKTKPIEELKAKEFLTVRNVASLLSCSVRSVYCYIDSGKLNAIKLSKRVTRIKRADLDKLFEKQPAEAPQQETKSTQYDIADCYTIGEIQTKFGVSQTAVQLIIKRNNIPKFQNGKFVYVPKLIIDNILTISKTLFD